MCIKTACHSDLPVLRRQPLEYLERNLCLVYRPQQVIMMARRDDVAGSAGVGECTGNRRRQADRLPGGVHVQPTRNNPAVIAHARIGAFSTAGG